MDDDRLGVHYSLNLRLKKNGTFFFGSGPAQLLEQVEQGASLHQAALAMHMAYSKAWHIVKVAEEHLGFPLLTSSRGGAGGGGSQLTEKGAAFLERYRLVQREIQREGEKLMHQYFGDMLH